MDFDLEWSRNNDILACCNAVLCLRYYRPRDAIVLCNPATKDAKLVPVGLLYPTHLADNQKLQLMAIGFGFDAKNNDRKLASLGQRIVYVYIIKWEKVQARG